MRPSISAEPHPAHRRAVDGLRALAFLGVFLFHAYPSRCAAGSLGVPVFFVLSGFLITRILATNEGPSIADDLRTFYIRRMLRIFPLYYAALAVLQMLGRLEQPWMSYFYVHNLGIYGQGYSDDFYGHFWTLSVEEQFYLIFPVLFLATPHAWRGTMLVGLWLGCAVSRHVLEQVAPNPFLGMLPNIAGEYLVAGAIAGLIDLRRPDAPFSAVRFCAALAGSVWVALWVGGKPIGGDLVGPFVPDAAALAFSTLVIEVWRSGGFIEHALSLRPIAFVGKISYGCYVFHLFALRIVESWLAPWQGSPLRLASGPLALVATLAVATASWHFFESPLLRLKTRFDYGRRSHRPALSSATNIRMPEAASRETMRLELTGVNT